VATSQLVGGLVGASLVLVLVAARSALIRWRRSRRARRVARRAVRGEHAAEVLVEAAGFTVVERQVELEWAPRLDGVPVPTLLRLDLVVERDGRRYVAEVKTGAVAPRLETAATRRQLLEYLVAADVDGVILVDAEAGLVREVEFPGRGLASEGGPGVAPPRPRFAHGVVVGVVVGIVAGVALAAPLARAMSGWGG
jgi:hypothetical protein